MLFSRAHEIRLITPANAIRCVCNKAILYIHKENNNNEKEKRNATQQC